MYKSYLAPTSESPDADRTKECNQLVVSLAFLVSITRPDIVRTHSVHARHPQNPGQQHLRSVRKTWKYIAATKYLALCATGDQDVREMYVSRDIEKTRNIYIQESLSSLEHLTPPLETTLKAAKTLKGTCTSCME